jgi:hypothetical protein
MSDTLTVSKSSISELSQTLATTINTLHSECLNIDDKLEVIVLQKINKVRECGVMLSEAKAQVAHGQWIGWIKVNLTMSEDTAQLYMRFARANAEPVRYLADGIKTVKDAMVACGSLVPASGHGQQVASTRTTLDRWVAQSMSLRELYRAEVEKVGELSTWSVEKVDAMKAALQPLHDIYIDLNTY